MAAGWAGGGKSTDRVEACAQVNRGRRKLAGFHRATKCCTASRVAGLRLKSNVTPASSWISRARARAFRRGGKAIAIGVKRAGEYQGQTGRAIFQIVKRLRVGCGRVGMIDALDHLPRLRQRRPATGFAPVARV